MEMFEGLAHTTNLTGKLWKSYNDDTFCVIEVEEVNAGPFLDNLNSLCPTVQFTIELEKDGSLPFLDTLLTLREDGIKY